MTWRILDMLNGMIERVTWVNFSEGFHYPLGYIDKDDSYNLLKIIWNGRCAWFSFCPTEIIVEDDTGCHVRQINSRGR